jgi:hypothetical protein
MLLVLASCACDGEKALPVAAAMLWRAGRLLLIRQVSAAGDITWLGDILLEAVKTTDPLSIAQTTPKLIPQQCALHSLIR